MMTCGQAAVGGQGIMPCPDAARLEQDVWTLEQVIRQLKEERGTYVVALEQIRSAPLAKESSIQRYKRCRDIADAALNAHAESRR
jgi:hypothetical protein